MTAPGTAGRAELVQRLVLDLGAAFQQRTAYAPGHPQVTTAIDRVLAALADWLAQAGTGEVSFLLLEGQLLVDRQPVPDDAPWGRGLLRAFHRHGIGGLTLLAGLDAAELGRFFDGCMTPTGPAPSAHVRLGQGGFTTGDAQGTAGEPATGGGRPPPFAAEEVEAARAELRALAAGDATQVERLRGLVSLLARGVDAVPPDALRATAARVDDREFLHGLAVALSTLRLGRALGLEGRPLEDLVLAGFLHDVGHLEPAGAGEAADRRRALHAVRGAARLAGIGGVPDVAVRVALEHHLRFDGAPVGPGSRGRRQPGAAARVVAVADTWETVRGSGKARTAEALAALGDRAGTFLDPSLAELFATLVVTPAPRASPGP